MVLLTGCWNRKVTLVEKLSGIQIKAGDVSYCVCTKVGFFDFDKYCMVMAAVSQ